MELEYETADVFTTTRFGGNPLAVVHGAEALDGARMQAIAREFNLSETVFVLPSGVADARLRIFTPGQEVPFAGHPNVGTAVLLARRMEGAPTTLRLEQQAGIVTAWISRNAAGTPTAAEIEAPLPLQLGANLDPGEVALCAGLPPGAIHLNGHPPIEAGCGLPFAIAEVEDVATLADATPDTAAFRRHLSRTGALLLHAPLGLGRRRVRMFSPLDGIGEDPATGSANCALAGLLLAVAGGSVLNLEVEQGVEMGRPSLLHLAARRDADGAIRVRVGGGVVPVARGTIWV